VSSALCVVQDVADSQQWANLCPFRGEGQEFSTGSESLEPLPPVAARLSLGSCDEVPGWDVPAACVWPLIGPLRTLVPRKRSVRPVVYVPRALRPRTPSRKD